MKKNDFKKLAILGMTAGSILSSQAAVAEQANISTQTLLAAHSCGSGTKCGSNKAPAPQPTDSQIADEEEQIPPTRGGCGGRATAPVNYRQAGCGNSTQAPTQR